MKQKNLFSVCLVFKRWWASTVVIDIIFNQKDIWVNDGE
jgi:hypothetical protein